MEKTNKTNKNDTSTTQHTSTYKAVEPIKTFSLIILEQDSLFVESSGKDRKIAAQKRKDHENIRLRVSSQMHTIYNSCSVINCAEHLNKIQITLKLTGSKFTPGQIVAVDIPYTLMRNLNTMISSRCTSNTSFLNPHSHANVVKDEFEALASADSGKSYRKTMKQFIAELCTYTRYVNEFNANNNNKTGSGGGSSTSSASSGATDKASSGGGAVAGSGGKHDKASVVLLTNIQLYVYSIVDDRVDSLSFCPQSLANARLS